MTSCIITAHTETRIFPLILGGVSVPQVGLLLDGWLVRRSIGIKRVRLVRSTLGTVQATSTDSCGTWASTGSDREIVWVRISGSADIRHVVRFSGRRERDRTLVVGASVAISVVVKVRAVGGGSSFRGGKRNILVEPLCTPSTNYRDDNEDQYCESNETYHAERASDGSSVIKETLAGIGIHSSGG